MTTTRPQTFRILLWLAGASLACLTFVVTGCGPSGPPTTEVTGTVTYKSAPVTNATITFFPASGPTAAGKVDEAGNFTIAAPEGTYKVTINPIGEIDENQIAGDPDAKPEEPPFPTKYRSMELTDLSVDVKMGQENTATFELKD